LGSDTTYGGYQHSPTYRRIVVSWGGKRRTPSGIDGCSDMGVMQAAQFRRFGGPEVLEVVTVQRPTPGPGEVLVHVQASAVNPHDTFLRDGTLKMMTGRTFPMGLGLDFAGEVVSVGTPMGVGSATVGEHVWGMVSPKSKHVTGSAAQYVVVPADRVAPFPRQLSMVEAASLVTPGETAVRAVRDVARTKRGDRVLVRGAAGGVGMIIVQLAHAFGAYVTALAAADDADFVRSIGADRALDYRVVTAKDLGRFDVIIDTVGRGKLAYRRLLTRHGRMLTINFGSGPALASIVASTVFGSRRIRSFSGYPDRQLLNEVGKYVESGALRPVVEAVYPLARIADAHEALATNRRPGKLVLNTSSAASDG